MRIVLGKCVLYNSIAFVRTQHFSNTLLYVSSAFVSDETIPFSFSDIALLFYLADNETIGPLNNIYPLTYVDCAIISSVPMTGQCRTIGTMTYSSFSKISLSLSFITPEKRY